MQRSREGRDLPAQSSAVPRLPISLAILPQTKGYLSCRSNLTLQPNSQPYFTLVASDERDPLGEQYPHVEDE